MKINFEGRYKSLKDFDSDYLENFCVITGPNGSGKTQVLEMLQHLDSKFSHTGNYEENDFKIEFVSPDFPAGHIRYIGYNELNPKNLGEMNYQKHVSLKQTVISLINQSQKNGPRSNQIDQNPVAKSIASKLGKQPRELTEEDVTEYQLSNEDLTGNDIFQLNLGQLFYNYAHLRDKNIVNTIRNQKYGTQFKVYSDEEFEDSFPCPWNLINNFLDKTKSNYNIQGVKEEDYNDNITLNPKFVHKVTNEKVDIKDLSSGEKVIISLAFCLFHVESSDDTSFPTILLLDEPDAPLHPSMSKEFLDVIYEELVLGRGIKVFMTTHSPSTIALTDERFIYSMANTPCELKKISKDNALLLLTNYIPNLSIDYKNHRQVFVESPTDRFYYETLYSKYNDEKRTLFQLYFISNGYGKGNCQQVIDVVKAIRASDNKTCFGIIDWDKKHENEDFVFVHGEMNRYSIENYVFDPAFFIILFMQMNALGIREYLGFDESFNEYEMGTRNEELQNGINWFFDKYYTKHRISEALRFKKIRVKYYNGIELELPEWFMIERGHTIESKLREIFEPLKSFRNEGDLQKRLTIIMAKCYPFVPIDTIETFDELVKVF